MAQKGLQLTLKERAMLKRSGTNYQRFWLSRHFVDANNVPEKGSPVDFLEIPDQNDPEQLQAWIVTEIRVIPRRAMTEHYAQMDGWGSLAEWATNWKLLYGGQDRGTNPEAKVTRILLRPASREEVANKISLAS